MRVTILFLRKLLLTYDENWHILIPKMLSVIALSPHLARKSRFSLAFAALIIAFSQPGTAQQSAVRVGCGSTLPYVDSLGRVWAADYGSSDGGSYGVSSAISGTPDRGSISRSAGVSRQ